MKKSIWLWGWMFLMVSCQNETPEQKVKSPEIHFVKEGNLKITDSLGHFKAVFDIEVADDDYQRETGLMYRNSMQDNQAMLFVFDNEQPRYFYMKNTYIPLDIIFVSKDSVIVSIAKDAKVMDEATLPSQFPAQYVLEVNAGLCEQKDIRPGDKLYWSINRD